MCLNFKKFRWRNFYDHSRIRNSAGRCGTEIHWQNSGRYCVGIDFQKFNRLNRAYLGFSTAFESNNFLQPSFNLKVLLCNLTGHFRLFVDHIQGLIETVSH